MFKMKKQLKVEITELFMAQADKYRRFFGTIKRDRDDNGNQTVHGVIKIKNRDYEGFIYSQANDQDELGQNLDCLCKLVLDADIHKSTGVTKNICETPFFLN